MNDICDPLETPGDPLCNQVLLDEALRSREAKRYPDPSARTDMWSLRFYARGTNDECTLRKRLEHATLGIPGTFQGQPLEYYEVRNIGWQLWEVTATYNWYGASNVAAQTSPSDKLPTQITLATTGGTIELTQSMYLVSKYPIEEGKSPPIFDGAINWDGQRVQGIQVGTASPRYTETWIVDREFMFESVVVDIADKDAVYPGTPVQHTYSTRFELFTDFTWSVHGPVPGLNSSQHPPTQNEKFRGWGLGNCALSGVNVRQIALDHFEVTLEFQIQPTKRFQVPKTVDSDEPDFVGEGWNYVWFYYGQKEQPANEGETEEYQMNAAVPLYMYEEQIYRRKNFIDLGFGNKAFDPTFNNLMCYASPDLEGAWDAICDPPDP